MKTIKSQFVFGIVLFFLIGFAAGFYAAALYAKSVADAALR